MQEVEFFKAAIKVAPVAMALHTGRDMKIEFANDMMLNAWGKDCSVIGKSFAEGLPQLASFNFQEKMNEVYITGVPFSAEQVPMEYMHNDAPRTFYYSYGFTPIKDNDGKVWGILNFAYDVTEQVIGREAIQRLQEKEQILQREQTLNEALRQTQQDLQNLNAELETRVTDRTEALSISENRFRAIIEQAPVAIVVFRGDEMLIDAVNPPMLYLLDKKKDIVGKPLLKAIPELAGQGPYELLYKIYTTGQPVYGFDTPVILNRTGKEEVGYYNFSYTPLIEDGKIIGVIDMAVEVTDQVKARQSVIDLNNELTAINAQLAESEANLRLTIEAASLGIWQFNTATGQLFIDQRCRQLYGFSADVKVNVEDVQQTVSPDYLPLLKGALRDAVQNGRSCDIQYPIHHLHTGEEIWLRTIGKIYQEGTGTAKLYGVTINVTEIKKDEQRKNDFISMVSHELKTPLTSLSGYLQILQSKTKKADHSADDILLDKSYSQVKRMTSMINGFLNLSRLESGKIQVDKTTFLLDSLVQEMIDESTAIQPNHIIQFHPCAPLTVHADRNKIGNVISNLLSNAIKYSPKNKTIEVKCEKIGPSVQVSVKDEGIGIEPKEIDKLFERYYRVKGDTTISGFGIGLYLSAEIVDRHNGKIWVESKLGKGSTFYFSLPLPQ
jgi:two-component system, OmpR family, sensor histidine kinase VicK